MLVRSWNLFHGNTVPPGRDAYLDEMLRLASSDDPDVLCVQEVPAAALGRFTAGDVAARPRLVSASLGERLTSLNHGLLRSAFSGQGNGLLVAPRFRVLAHKRLTLNPRRFRDAQARALGLGLAARLAWAKERRIVQALRLADAEGRTYLVANLHCTSYAAEVRLAEAELLRAAWFATSTAAPGDVIVLAGDFNLTESSNAVEALNSSEWGFSAPGPGIDQILVRGCDVSPLRVWLPEQRTRDGRLLSDHAPVELDLL
ncbi:MAG TPA: endonuclease/exonuclease/phosphatase family protein [Gaiellaceae bacterium]|nr:endonuclease/exonuclease/phosphatase family protein [Gaiellaceae bacterium]